MSEPLADTKPEGLPPADAELVAAVLRGDLGSFDELVGRYQRQATSLAYRLLGSMDDALDVTQEAFLRAYRKIDSLTEPKRFGAWLLRIVAHQALNYRRGRSLRRNLRLEDLGTPDESTGKVEINHPDPKAEQPTEMVLAGELKDRIAEALKGLPEKQRQALVLFSVERMPQKEVAQVLGISVEAVKWHVFTARKKLKDVLKEFL